MNARDLIERSPEIAAQVWALTKPKLKEFWRYAKVELVPPGPTELPKAVVQLGGIVKTFATLRFRDLTVAESWANFLVTVEVGCWFYVGECIGKRHLVGYKV